MSPRPYFPLVKLPDSLIDHSCGVGQLPACQYWIDKARSQASVMCSASGRIGKSATMFALQASASRAAHEREVFAWGGLLLDGIWTGHLRCGGAEAATART
jgi:hypothetical protein